MVEVVCSGMVRRLSDPSDPVNESVVVTFMLLFVVNFVMSAIYFQLVPPKTG
jgi:hypothetical protein